MAKLNHFALICLITGACIPPAFGQTTPVPPATSAQPASSATPAPVAPASSAAAEAFRIVPEDQTKQWWAAADGNSPPPFPFDAITRNLQGCMVIAFAIHANGTTTPIQITKTYWTSYDPTFTKRLEQRAIDHVANWQFTPATRNATRTPILTYATITYEVSGIDAHPASSTNMKKKCAVSNFARDMQKLLGSPDKPSAAK